jgi:hypothetical protein
MAILTTSGRTALAQAVAAQPLHLAWGSGDPAWDTTPVPEPVSATALLAELGRRAASQVTFVTPDLGGSISVPNGKFSPVSAGQKSNNLYLRFNFDYTDAPSALIREVAIYVGTTIKPEVGGGQTYFLPADLLDPGTLLGLQRPPKVIRSANTRQSFEFVLTL